MVESGQENQQPYYDDGNGAVRVLWKKNKLIKNKPVIRACQMTFSFNQQGQNADLPQIRACQIHRQAPEFSFFFNEKLEEKCLQCATGLKCTYLKIACQGVQVAHEQDDFI